MKVDETDPNAKPAEDGAPAASKPKKQRGPSLEKLSKSVSCPLPFNYPTLVSSPSTGRFQKKGAVQRSVGAGGILMLLDMAPEEPTEWIEPSTGLSRNTPVAQEGPVAAVAEADPPPFFEYPFGGPSTTHIAFDMNSYPKSNPEAIGLSAHPSLTRPPPEEMNNSSTPSKDHHTKRLASLDHLRIAELRIRRLHDDASEVKSGGYGDVELAILDAEEPDESRHDSEDVVHVAVKKIRYGTDDDDHRVLARFTREITLLHDLDHENIAQIIGFVEHFEDGVLWMIFPWEKNGNLREFVRSANWELPERISLIDDVARGVAYLHGREPPICHGDLKSLNVLINDEHRAAIADFGSARAVDTATPNAKSSAKATPRSELQLREAIERSLKAELSATRDSLMMTGPGWTMRWAAPELLLDTGSAGLASDVWALGWIFWEGITGNFPFSNEDKDVQVVLRITRGDLPKLETDIQFAQVKALCSLMMECWSLEVDERPSALACQQRLNYMDKAVPSKNVGTRSARLLLALGRIHQNNGALEEQLKYTNMALEVARTTQNAVDEAEALKELGTVAYLENRYSEAEKAYNEARNIFSRIGHQLGLA
ncbi:hypothetical protein FRB90_000994, partial [Tulasnella sp. 427]